jgi:hypothetical protein
MASKTLVLRSGGSASAAAYKPRISHKVMGFPLILPFYPLAFRGSGCLLGPASNALAQYQIENNRLRSQEDRMGASGRHQSREERLFDIEAFRMT